MRIIAIDSVEYNKLCDLIEQRMGFNPNRANWLDLPWNHVIYKHYENGSWNTNQESLVNSIFKRISSNLLYAIDWQHDFFEFLPDEDLGHNYTIFDSERCCNVFFPSYYPNGDFYFFFDANYDFGLFGNPFTREFKVYGEKLILEFDSYQQELGIVRTKYVRR
ncbi:MAG: DUF2716 domain-containing protein [Saccharofermentans sp.]|jgi:hypothetical protein|nr:DUF2716 domain-containing protein [Saccharofermentans sp.]